MQSRKLQVQEQLKTNTDDVNQVQASVNSTLLVDTGTVECCAVLYPQCSHVLLVENSSALRYYVEAVTDARKLEAENSHQWKQVKQLLKYVKNQERETARTEKY